MSLIDDLVKDFIVPLTGPEYSKDNLFDEILRDLGAHNSSSTTLETLKGKKCLHIDLPGVDKQDIVMEVDENGIRVKAERKGFKAQVYTKSYKLPKDTNLEKVEAKYENGVLKVYLLKTDSKKSKSVRIE